MFPFVVFDLLFQYLAKRSATWKNVSEMTYFVSGET